jgi:hypothetical protein
MKQEFEMSYAEMDKIICINKANSNTVMMVGGVDFSNNLTEAINAYWKILADKYGFEWDTVEGSSKGKLFFLAKSKPIIVPKTRIEIEMDKYDTIKKIVEQLEFCYYEAKGGFLNDNVAFLSLKRMAKS